MADLERSSTASHLPGGGAMGECVRAIDWSKTPLGPIEEWPASLLTTVNLALASTFPIAIAWGPCDVQIYNDGYWPICGAKHPHSMGQSFRECWASAFPVIGQAYDQAWTGQASYLENQRLFVDRYGYLEEAFFTFSFSPIRDETGKVAGLFHPVTETTGRMLSERRIRAVRDLAARAGKAQTVDEACAIAAHTLADYALDLPFVLIYLLDGERKILRLAGATGLAPASSASPEIVALEESQPVWPLSTVLDSGQAKEVENLAARFGAFACGPYPEAPPSAFVQPIQPPGLTQPIGVMVAGVSSRRPLDEAYRDFYVLLGNAVTLAVGNALAFEEERKRAEALASLDRAKTAFFSNVSHEFRTPLALMIGPLEEALASSDPALKDHELRLVHRNTLRLLKLVNTLLEFSRVEAGRTQASYTATDLAALTTDLASSFRSAIECGGLRFDVRCAPLPQPVYVDRDMWEKIVMNLLSNAFKHTLEGSIEVSLTHHDDHVRLRVSDTGVGIAESELPKVFERFHRVEGTRARTHEGSGIGLALVAELVRLHGGRVGIDSQLGKGTVVTVNIPTGKAHLPSERIDSERTLTPTATARSAFVEEALRWLPADRPQTIEPAAHVDVESRARILLADDNADMREYIARLLRPYWEVEAVADGALALEAARRGRFDVILADVMMPNLDGFALLRAIRSDPEIAPTPFMMLSARAGEESRVEGISAGADDYLVKPFSARELLVRVQSQITLGRTQTRLRARTAELSQLLKQAPVAIAVWRGPEHVYELANPRYEQIFGRRQYIGRRIRDVFTNTELAQQGLWDIFDEVYRTGTPFAADDYIMRFDRNGDGSLVEGVFNYTLSPLRNHEDEIVGLVSIAIEVTEHFRARKQIERAGAIEVDLRQEAEAANRTKDEFLAMLGHELRNPLAPILTALQLMNLRKCSGGEKERAVIERQVRHLVRLIEDLLDVSRIAQGKITLRRTKLELATVVARALEIASPLLEEKAHTLEVEVPTTGLLVQGDEARLVQVVTNLVTNAAKYTEHQGRIEVKAALENDSVVLTVRDNGIGISRQMLPSVFDLFTQGQQTSERSQGGLGLGLSIVKNLVELHGGSVSAASEGPTSGSEFTVRLPACLTAEDSLAATGSSPLVGALAAGADGARILLVDDNQDAADLLAESLAERGHHVTVAYDAAEALNAVERFVPEIALLDIGLPVIDGYELARRMKATADLGRTKFVAITGYGQDVDRERSTKAGFDRHLVKPVDVDTLVAVVDELRPRRQESSDHMHVEA